MALTTRFTELLGVPHPIVLAPMGGSAGGALAAAAFGISIVGTWTDAVRPHLGSPDAVE